MNVEKILADMKEAVDKAEKYDRLELNFKNAIDKSPVQVLRLIRKHGLPNDNQTVKIPKFVAEWLEVKKKNKDSLHVAIDGDWQIMPETMKAWLGVEFNDEKFARAWLDGYEVEEEPKWVVNEGDLVIKKGKHEAKVYFVECVDRNIQGEVTGILLVNGIQDKSYNGEDSEPVSSFFNEFRLLAKENNLEKEVSE